MVGVDSHQERSLPTTTWLCLPPSHNIPGRPPGICSRQGAEPRPAQGSFDSGPSARDPLLALLA